MSTEIANVQTAEVSEVGHAVPADRLANVFVKGNLATLTDHERAAYYMAVCESTGLNPATRPFEFISMKGKVVLYALKGATDQLRKINGVSLDIATQATVNGVHLVTVRATDKFGRTDTDIGVVPLDGLKGDDLANAFMKAITKAKRRVTLSICGLGMLDETEVETVRDAVPFRPSSVTVRNQDADPDPAEVVEGSPTREDNINKLKLIFTKFAPPMVEKWFRDNFNKPHVEDLSDFELEAAVQRVTAKK